MLIVMFVFIHCKYVCTLIPREGVDIVNKILQILVMNSMLRYIYIMSSQIKLQ